MGRPDARPSRAALATVLALSIGVLAGCSDDGGDEPSGGGQGGSETVETVASLGQVAGRLPRARRDVVVRSVTETVDRWIDAAFLGDYPRAGVGDAFGVFTADAARRARSQGALSNVQVGERIDAVSATRRKVVVDVLAPKGRPAGATARLTVVLELSGEVERTDRVSGRLTLTPAGNGWKVFGWDLDRKAEK